MRIVVAILLLAICSFMSFAETYVVCVGIGNYVDVKVQNLAKTENDAKAIAELFKRGTDNVITITGK